MGKVVNVQLQRYSDKESWGFRLQGGADYKALLSVQKVTPGSCASQILSEGDVVLMINGKDVRSSCHFDACCLIKNSERVVDLVIRKVSDQPLCSENLHHQLKLEQQIIEERTKLEHERQKRKLLRETMSPPYSSESSQASSSQSTPFHCTSPPSSKGAICSPPIAALQRSPQSSGSLQTHPHIQDTPPQAVQELPEQQTKQVCGTHCTKEIYQQTHELESNMEMFSSVVQCQDVAKSHIKNVSTTEKPCSSPISTKSAPPLSPLNKKPLASPSCMFPRLQQKAFPFKTNPTFPPRATSPNVLLRQQKATPIQRAASAPREVTTFHTYNNPHINEYPNETVNNPYHLQEDLSGSNQVSRSSTFTSNQMAKPYSPQQYYTALSSNSSMYSTPVALSPSVQPFHEQDSSEGRQNASSYICSQINPHCLSQKLQSLRRQSDQEEAPVEPQKEPTAETYNLSQNYIPRRDASISQSLNKIHCTEPETQENERQKLLQQMIHEKLKLEELMMVAKRKSSLAGTPRAKLMEALAEAEGSGYVQEYYFVANDNTNSQQKNMATITRPNEKEEDSSTLDQNNVVPTYSNAVQRRGSLREVEEEERLREENRIRDENIRRMQEKKFEEKMRGELRHLREKSLPEETMRRDEGMKSNLDVTLKERNRREMSCPVQDLSRKETEQLKRIKAESKRLLEHIIAAEKKREESLIKKRTNEMLQHLLQAGITYQNSSAAKGDDLRQDNASERSEMASENTKDERGEAAGVDSVHSINKSIQKQEELTLEKDHQLREQDIQPNNMERNEGICREEEQERVKQMEKIYKEKDLAEKRLLEKIILEEERKLLEQRKRIEERKKRADQKRIAERATESKERHYVHAQKLQESSRAQNGNSLFYTGNIADGRKRPLTYAEFIALQNRRKIQHQCQAVKHTEPNVNNKGSPVSQGTRPHIQQEQQQSTSTMNVLRQNAQYYQQETQQQRVNQQEAKTVNKLRDITDFFPDQNVGRLETAQIPEASRYQKLRSSPSSTNDHSKMSSTLPQNTAQNSVEPQYGDLKRQEEIAMKEEARRFEEYRRHLEEKRKSQLYDSDDYASDWETAGDDDSPSTGDYSHGKPEKAGPVLLERFNELNAASEEELYEAQEKSIRNLERQIRQQTERRLQKEKQTLNDNSRQECLSYLQHQGKENARNMRRQYASTGDLQRSVSKTLPVTKFSPDPMEFGFRPIDKPMAKLSRSMGSLIPGDIASTNTVVADDEAGAVARTAPLQEFEDLVPRDVWAEDHRLSGSLGNLQQISSKPPLPNQLRAKPRLRHASSEETLTRSATCRSAEEYGRHSGGESDVTDYVESPDPEAVDVSNLLSEYYAAYYEAYYQSYFRLMELPWAPR